MIGQDQQDQFDQQSQLVTKKFSVRLVLGIWTASYAIAILLTTLVLASTGNIGENIDDPNWFLDLKRLSEYPKDR